MPLVTRFRGALVRVHGTRTLFTIVDQAEVAYRELLGWTRTRLEPGPRLFIPIVHKLTRVDLREQSVSVSIEAYTRDNVPVCVSADVFYSVMDAEKACFAVKNLQGATSSVAASTVRAVVGRFVYDSIIQERTALSVALIAEIGTSIETWGVACRKVEVHEFSPQNASVAKQLEQQLEAERARRKTELDTRASVNVAEGQKRATELRAEGDALATAVSADADRYAKQQAAEADKFAVEKRGEAAAAELVVVAAVLGDSRQAAEYLLQQRKLAHLAALAGAGVNTNTYIVPDAASLLPTLAVNAVANAKSNLI